MTTDALHRIATRAGELTAMKSRELQQLAIGTFFADGTDAETAANQSASHTRSGKPTKGQYITAILLAEFEGR